MHDLEIHIAQLVALLTNSKKFKIFCIIENALLHFCCRFDIIWAINPQEVPNHGNASETDIAHLSENIAQQYAIRAVF